MSKRRAVSKKTSKVVDSDNEDDIATKQLSMHCINTRHHSMKTRRQSLAETIASSVATRTIHVLEQPKRLKPLKQLVDLSNAKAQRSSSPAYPRKNSGDTSQLATERSSVRMIEVSDSEDTMPLSQVRGQRKGTMDFSNSISSEGLLNSKMFCCYMEHIWSQFSERKRKSFTHMDCMWFHLYAESERKETVLDWIKGAKIFSKTYVLVPIVIWSHWNLLIFCHLGESLQSRSKTPCMLLLDSLQTMNPKRLEPLIRKFVIDIFRKEKRPEKKELIHKIPLLIPRVPQQIDDKKCGYFVLYYINLFIKDAPKDFSIHDGYPYFMKEDWFTLEGLDNFCRLLDSVSLDDY